MANSSSLPTPDETSGDLVPLPVAHRQALAAVTVIACVSVASSGAALLYLTIKLVRWHLRTWRQAQRASRETNPVDLSLGLADCHFGAEDAKPREPRSGKNTHPNQFLVLLFNLLLADLHQAAAFLLNAVWVGRNGILIHTPVCWAQGWLVSTGDLSSSLFITAIAVHTYSAVLHKYQPPRWVLYTAVVAAWAFDYFMATLGVLITGNGKDAGGFFVRAAAWCWVNIRYETHRLLLHYLWIFISLAITSILYTVITISLSKHPGDEEPSFPTTVSATHIGNPQHDGDGNDDDNNNDHQRLPPTTATTITSVAGPTTPTTPKPPTLTNHPAETRRGNDNGNGSNSRGSGSYPKVFLLYPVIYVVCTLPLAAGRIATMAGARVPIAYFCVAGALITSNGWLDVLLWGLTRRRLLFGADVDAPSAGLDTFTFMRTPPGRRYGNLVWVEGGSSSPRPALPPTEQRPALTHRPQLGGSGQGQGQAEGEVRGEGQGGERGSASSALSGGIGKGKRKGKGKGKAKGVVGGGPVPWEGRRHRRRRERPARSTGLFGWVRRRMGWRPLGLGGTGGGDGAAAVLGRDGGRGARGRETAGANTPRTGGDGASSGMAIQMDMVTSVFVEEARRSRERRNESVAAGMRGPQPYDDGVAPELGLG